MENNDLNSSLSDSNNEEEKKNHKEINMESKNEEAKPKFPLVTITQIS
jgi:hypothetical protein